MTLTHPSSNPIPEANYTCKNNVDYHLSKQPVSEGRIFSYGTAGFRSNAKELQFLYVRAATAFAHYAALRSGHTYGIMVTASHNHGPDNGIKFVGPQGAPIETQLIKALEFVVNLTDDDYELHSDGQIVRKLLHDLPSVDTMSTYRDNDVKNDDKSLIVIGYDTRESSTFLANALIQGILLSKQNVAYKLTPYPVTTPQLHWLVMYPLRNDDNDETLAQVLHKLAAPVELIPESRETVYIDCANGVGACHVENYLKLVKAPQKFIIVNNQTGNDTTLNSKCGADYVKSKGLFPLNCDDVPPFTRVASFDGDADRMLYFMKDDSGKMFKFDGDHLSKLFTQFIVKQTTLANYKCNIGTVYTGYSDIAMQGWITRLGVQSARGNTGVAHLIQKAVQYDIGIYFEPNGHGSVLLKPGVMESIREHAENSEPLRKLVTFLELINPAIGDGIGNFFATEYILNLEEVDTRLWRSSTFEPANGLLYSLSVPDKNVFIVDKDDETILVEPQILVDCFDTLKEALKREYGDFSYFIRPSGTENTLRLFIQAPVCEGTPDFEAVGIMFTHVIEKYCNFTGQTQTLVEYLDYAKHDFTQQSGKILSFE